MKSVLCIGPGPHAPRSGVLGAIEDDQDPPRAVCAACAEKPTLLPAPPAAEEPKVPDIAEIFSRLEAAESTIFQLVEANPLPPAEVAEPIVAEP